MIESFTESIKPPSLSLKPTNLNAAFCESGMFTKPSTIVLPSPPLVDSALKLKPESNSEDGFFVIIFKLPACDAAP